MAGGTTEIITELRPQSALHCLGGADHGIVRMAIVRRQDSANYTPDSSALLDAPLSSHLIFSPMSRCLTPSFWWPDRLIALLAASGRHGEGTK